MNTKSPLAVERDPARFLQLRPDSASVTLCLALIAVGFLIAVPRADAAMTVSTGDNNFILAAAQDGMTEVELGELAARKGLRDDVKAFGRMMVKDHTGINGDLKALAAQKGVILPDRLDVKHQGMVDKMATLAGSEFDDAYIAAMIKGHQEVAQEFKFESAEANDADVKSFVEKFIPVVNEHLKRILALRK